jgi:hypothetical protein
MHDSSMGVGDDVMFGEPILMISSGACAGFEGQSGASTVFAWVLRPFLSVECRAEMDDKSVKLCDDPTTGVCLPGGVLCL